MWRRILFTILAIVLYLGLRSPMTITISSPQSYRIFQRSSLDWADIPISGTYAGTPTTIEASWNGGAYEVIDAAPAAGVYSGVLTNQDAGQGTLTVRFGNDPATTATVAFVGIGDVFFVIGQSNAEGNGTANQVYTHPSLKASMWQVGGSSWLQLADPTHNVKGSVWPLVATLHMASQGVPVGFICTAVGGTGLTNGDWKKGGFYYQQALDTLRNSGVNAVKAMLWHQGEQDVSDNASQAAYQTALSQMVDDMAADTTSIPIFLGGVTLRGVKLVAAQIGDRNTAPSVQVDRIRLAIQNRWNNDPDILAGPLTYDIDLNDGDGVHFGSGTDGQYEQQTLANRWWRMLSYHYYGGVQGRAPRFVSAARSGTAVTVTFTGGVYPLVGKTDTTGWKFTDNGTPITVTAAADGGGSRVVLTLASAPVGIGLITFGSNEDAHGTTFKDSGTYAQPPEPFIDQSTTGSVSAESGSIVLDTAFAFYVDVEDLAGAKLGSGPLTSVSRWSYTASMDRAGAIACTFLASDKQAGEVQNERFLRAWALLNGVWTEVGYGRIDNCGQTPDEEGVVSISAGGLDVTVELSDRSVRNLAVGTGTGTSHANALSLIGAFAPGAWALIPAPAPANDFMYARFAGESVLSALVEMAEKTQTHFYRGTGRELIFSSEFEDSGIRAMRAGGDLTPQTAAISALTRTVDTHGLLTRIYPYGSGNGDTRLTLAASTRTAPVGYVLNKVQGYIEDTAAIAAYGLREVPEIEFKEIAPIANTDADLRAATNMLFDATLAELKRRASLSSQDTYEITLSGCSRLLRPLQSLRVVYFDPQQNIDINEDLLILESTWEASQEGIRTSRLVVSTDDRWPDSDILATADRTVQGKIFIAHPQIGPSAYWTHKTMYVGVDQTNHTDTFPFILGTEVSQVQQVLFRFKIEGVLSFTSNAITNTVSSGSSSSTSTNSNSKATSDNGGSVTTLPLNTMANTQTGPPYGIYDPTGATGAMSQTATPAVGVNHSHLMPHLHDIPHNHTLTLAAHGHGMDHTHGIDHTHNVTPTLLTSYGLFRAPASRTYAFADLEFTINGSAWISLASGVARGNGYLEIDLTALTPNLIYDTATFRPLSEDNVIEIRRKSSAGVLSIVNSTGFTTYVNVVTTAAHGLLVGDAVTIGGTGHHNGNWTVTEIISTTAFKTNQTGDTNVDGGGSLTITMSAMVQAILGIRNTIQAIQYG
jgi:hypothetical protein